MTEKRKLVLGENITAVKNFVNKFNLFLPSQFYYVNLLYIYLVYFYIYTVYPKLFFSAADELAIKISSYSEMLL